MLQYVRYLLSNRKGRFVLENEKKNNIFSRFFNPNRLDRPDALEEDTTPNVKRYFKLLGRKFWKLVSLNIMMLPMVIPVILILYLYLGFDRTPTATNPVFSQLYGANLINSSTETSFLLDLFGRQTLIPVYDVVTYVLMGICVLFLAITFGWQNVGSTYILRNMVRGEPVFISEYGGIGINIESDGARKKAWSYGKSCSSYEEFYARYKGLTDAILDNPRILGFCYTQLTDVEQEMNGIFNFETREPKFDLEILSSINKRKAAIED